MFLTKSYIGFVIDDILDSLSPYIVAWLIYEAESLFSFVFFYVWSESPLVIIFTFDGISFSLSFVSSRGESIL